MAIPATEARSGTPELYSDKVEAHTEPIEVEPFDPRASDTWRMAYGNWSRDGKTGSSARSASAPWPISRRFGEPTRSEEHTSELQSRFDLVCRLLLEKKNAILVYFLLIFIFSNP